MGHMRRNRGQMTMELAVTMPVLIVVALIAFNAMTFFGDCAVFDRITHDAVRIYASAPAYRQGIGQRCDLIEQTVRSRFGDSNHEVRVSHGVTGVDFDEYTATLEFYPTLFGRELRSDVFGVTLPHLTHTTRYVVDSYKPGLVV